MRGSSLASSNSPSTTPWQEISVTNQTLSRRRLQALKALDDRVSRKRIPTPINYVTNFEGEVGSPSIGRKTNVCFSVNIVSQNHIHSHGERKKNPICAAENRCTKLPSWRLDGRRNAILSLVQSRRPPVVWKKSGSKLLSAALGIDWDGSKNSRLVDG